MGMTLLLIAMDIIKFQTSEKLYIFVMILYTLIWKQCMIYLFCFLSYECSVYTVLFNKCINENIAVLNNEIMSFRISYKGSLSLKKTLNYRLRAFHGYIKFIGITLFFGLFEVLKGT